MADRVFSLVADVGGTNTRIALAEGPKVLRETISKFENVRYESLQAVLREYLADHPDCTCSKAAVAIAGPVRDGRGGLTNLNWHIDEADLNSI